jgi:glycosyltransferase involved in cell wall biosynthesis
MLRDQAVIVVVPAYQEEAHVGRVIETMPAFVDHILVIDDASSDRTSEVAREAADASSRRVRILQHPRRRGVGAPTT